MCGNPDTSPRTAPSSHHRSESAARWHQLRSCWRTAPSGTLLTSLACRARSEVGTLSRCRPPTEPRRPHQSGRLRLKFSHRGHRRHRLRNPARRWRHPPGPRRRLRPAQSRPGRRRSVDGHRLPAHSRRRRLIRGAYSRTLLHEWYQHWLAL